MMAIKRQINFRIIYTLRSTYFNIVDSDKHLFSETIFCKIRL